MDAGAEESMSSNSVEQGSGIEERQTVIRMDETTSKKRSWNNNEDNGPKTCNCKGSRCLELNCSCFSAGYYCGDICSCHEYCMNKTDYEDTVDDVREQIELWNLDAFVPKVVEQGTGSSTKTTEHEQYRPRIRRKLNF